MRKINAQLRAAWNNNKTAHIDNTYIYRDDSDRLILVLHSHDIARKDLNTGKTEITLAGWNTLTTRARIKEVLGVNIYSKQSQAYLQDMPIDSDQWYPVAE